MEQSNISLVIIVYVIVIMVLILLYNKYFAMKSVTVIIHPFITKPKKSSNKI